MHLAGGVAQPQRSIVGDAQAQADAVVSALLAHLLPALDAFDADGLAPLLARWQPLDALVGQTVQLTEGDSHHVGALRLRDAAGQVHDFYSGDASVRPA